MTGPRSGSALYAASWASPTASKTRPTSHSSDPGRRRPATTARRSARADLDRQRDEPQRDALDQEHLAHGDGEADLAHRAPEQRLVARVLTVARRPGGGCARRGGAPMPPPSPAAPTAGPRPRPPRAPRRAATATNPRPQATSTTATRPTAPGDQRRHGHDDRDGRESDEQHRPDVVHRWSRHRVRTGGRVCAAPGRTIRIWSTPIRPSRKAIAPPTR